MLKDRTAGNLVDEFAKELSSAQRITAARRILDGYADLISEDGAQGSWRGDNFEEFLKDARAAVPAEPVDARGQQVLHGEAVAGLQGPALPRRPSSSPPAVRAIPAADKERFEDRLVKQWDKIINNWVNENEMSVATDYLWGQLSDDTKAHLIGHFVSFVNNSRGSRHEQYRLADRVLRMDESKPAIRAAIRKQAREAAESRFDTDDEYLDEEGIKRVKKSVANAMSRMKTYFEGYDKVARAAVTRYVEQLECDE